MKSLPRINFRSALLTPLFLLSLVFSLNTFSNAQAQQLSLADILIALRSKKATLPEKNKILTDAVRERGITFALSAEIEKELSSTGADSALIEAIRQKSPVIKPVSNPQTQPSPANTPAPKPIPTPTPPDSAFYQNRATSYVIKGEYDLAVADFSKAIELKPEDASNYLNRGLAFFNKKSYALAVADYDKVIELNPKDSKAYFNRGESHEKMGEIQKAIVDYQKAVDLDASNELAKSYLQRLQAEQAKLSTPVQKTETATVNDAPKTPQSVEIGQLNALATMLVNPAYPEIARRANVKGSVTVQISLDEEGKVVAAKATEGPLLLRAASEDAARKSKFKPAQSAGKAVKATGFIVYNFKAN
jgi:TonB family protein